MGIAPTAGAAEAETHPENHCNSRKGGGLELNGL